MVIATKQKSVNFPRRPQPSKPRTSQQPPRHYIDAVKRGINGGKNTKQNNERVSKGAAPLTPHPSPVPNRSVPASLLVGIEPNPGPPKTIAKKRILKKEKAVVKKIVKKEYKPSLGRTGLRAAGGFLGNMIGMPSAGRSAGDWFSDILGMGDYRVKTNSIAKSTGDVPVFAHSADGSVIIDHSELVTDVFTSSGFTNLSWAINPGNINLFPWLGNLARNYETYEFLGLVFIFKTTSANALNSINAALGTHIMSTEYDLSKPLFRSKQEMESYMFTVSTEPSVSVMHPVECNPKQDVINARFVDAALVSRNNSLSLDDTFSKLGLFQFASVGSQSSYASGELHVSYKIKLSKPRAQPAGTTTAMQHYSNRYLSTGGSPSGTTAALGMLQVVDESTMPDHSGNPQITASGNNMVISFAGMAPQRKFLVYITHFVGGGTVAPGTVTTWTNLINDGWWFPTATDGTSTSGMATPAASTSIYMAAAKTNDNNWTSPGSMTYSAPTTVGTTHYYTDVVIVEVPITGPSYASLSMKDEISLLNERIAMLSTGVQLVDDEKEQYIPEDKLDSSVYIPRSTVAKLLGR